MNHSRDAKKPGRARGAPPVALVDRARMELRVQGCYWIVSELGASIKALREMFHE
jgi:hypothetical protein